MDEFTIVLTEVPDNCLQLITAELETCPESNTMFFFALMIPMFKIAPPDTVKFSLKVAVAVS